VIKWTRMSRIVQQRQVRGDAVEIRSPPAEGERNDTSSDRAVEDGHAKLQVDNWPLTRESWRFPTCPA
jgi:hypothetical protein